MNKSAIRYVDGKCIHFNGTAAKICLAGVRYADVAIKKPYGSIPCFAKNTLDTCRRREFPTAEQLTEKDAAIADYIGNITIVRSAIMAKITASGNERANVSGKIPCPICETGEVHFSRAGAYNGHVHAKCTTPDCVSWIE